MTASTLSRDTEVTFRARCLTPTRGPFTFSSSSLLRYCRSFEVRFEIVLEGRLNECRMVSKFIDDGWDCVPESVDDVLERNLALFKTARVSAWSMSRSSSSNSDRSCSSWLLNRTLPRALELLLGPSLGEILTLFIFRFRSPVSLVWKSEPTWCCFVVVDKGVAVAGCFKTILSVMLLWEWFTRRSSIDPPQFFWQLAPVLKLFPLPPHPPYLEI